MKFIIPIVAGIIILLVLDKILKAFGIKKSKKELDREESVVDLTTEKAFDPYYHKGKTFKPLGMNQSIIYADLLRKAVRGWGTDEDQIYSVFGQLDNKTQISEIADQYKLKYDRDLLGDILGDLTAKEKEKLWSIIKTLKNV